MPPSKKTAAKKTTPKAASASKSTVSAADPDLGLIASLADILNSTGLTEIELDRKGTRVRVAKMVTAVASVSSHAPSPHVVSHPVASVESAAPIKAAGAEQAGTIKSPMVGTVYMAPSPGTPNFIEIGSMVKEGQTLLIIEAMKTMNQIHAPRAGKVTHIYVDNGTPVEYGEPLVAIE